MYKHKLCLGVLCSLERTPEEQIRLFKEVGFDGFFIGWSGDLTRYRALADELGMIFQSVHAPFHKSDKMWTSFCNAYGIRRRPTFRSW